MAISVGDLIRHIVIGIIVLILLIFGLKVWNKHKLEKQIIRELRDLAHPTTSFEANHTDDATSALFQSMELLHRAKVELDKEPAAILKEVFHGDDDGALFGKAETGRNAYANPLEEIIRKGLLRNYQHSRSLGLFSNGENRDNLADGKAPFIANGPSVGAKATIRYIIDPQVSPGVENLIPNMIISPPDLEAREKPTDLEITQAKDLIGDLDRARLIEREAGDRLRQHYEHFNNPAEPEPEPEEEPQPEPKPEPEDKPATKPVEEDDCPFVDPLPDNG
ncbi:MAG: hypothetical protein MK194_03290 [Roseibacillus sp.]|nr:hypothetical protein [Roseibacillus sp.]